MANTSPFGSWKSPITADLIVSESIGLGAVTLDGKDIYWVEMRPAEKGRYVVVRCTPDGRCTDFTPPEFNVRTRVHEYGGGAYVVHDGIVYFSNFADQRLYGQRQPSSPPVPEFAAPSSQSSPSSPSSREFAARRGFAAHGVGIWSRSNSRRKTCMMLCRGGRSTVVP